MVSNSRFVERRQVRRLDNRYTVGCEDGGDPGHEPVEIGDVSKHVPEKEQPAPALLANAGRKICQRIPPGMECPTPGPRGDIGSGFDSRTRSPAD